MRQTKFLLPTSVYLIRPVFAGCCQPLLEDGPSRRYLHNLCKGAWTHTPPRSLAFVRFGQWALPTRDIGLATRGDGLGTRKYTPAMQLQQGGFLGAAVIH